MTSQESQHAMLQSWEDLVMTQSRVGTDGVWWLC